MRLAEERAGAVEVDVGQEQRHGAALGDLPQASSGSPKKVRASLEKQVGPKTTSERRPRRFLSKNVPPRMAANVARPRYIPVEGAAVTIL